MTVATAAGVTIGITSAAPATLTRLGWEACAFTTIGEITDLGEFGRAYAKAEHKPITTRGTRKLKASYDDGAVTLGLGLDNSDAGQVLLKSARLSDAAYYFCITLPAGDRYFFAALVIGFKANIGSSDNIISASATLEIVSTGVFEDLNLPAPPAGYAFVTTNGGNTFVTTNGGATRLIAKAA